MKEHGEVYSSGDCLLWQRAKTLAQERGLELNGKCPLEDMCKGEYCNLLSDTEKLEVLREELRNARKNNS